jgi:hypothetical protein
MLLFHWPIFHDFAVSASRGGEEEAWRGEETAKKGQTTIGESTAGTPKRHQRLDKELFFI